MYATIHENFIKNNRKKAFNEAIDMFGVEGREDMLIFEDVEPNTLKEIGIHDDSIEVVLNNNMRSFSFNIPLDSDDWEKLLSVMIKRMNKIKSLMESLK